MNTCKKCGNPVAQGAEFCFNCGTKLKQKKLPVWAIVLIVIGAVVLFVLLFAEEKTPNEQAAPGLDVSANSNSPVPTIEPTKSPEPVKTEFGIGEIAEYRDVYATLVNVTENYGDGFLVPEEGNIYVVCEFLIENHSDSEINVSSILSFDGYVDDFSVSVDLGASTSTEQSQLGGTVASGKKLSGVIGFEVPENWQTLEIRFEPNVWSGKEIVFVHSK